MLKQEIGCIQSGPFAPPVGPAGYDDADAGRTPPYRWGCTKGGCLAISESLETLQVSLRGWLANFFFDFLDTHTVFYLYSMLVFTPYSQ